MKRFLSLCLAVLLVCGVAVTAGAADVKPEADFTVRLPVEFCQTEARKIFDYINAFRTGNNAWYWNESNTEKVTVSGLQPLQYDYALEQIAMQRAAEIALRFSHTRPNGELCFSLYGPCTAAAENIAAGQQDAKQVHAAWLEEDEPYVGQGHRRNILSGEIEAVGIGCVTVDQVRYWVEAFRRPADSAAKTEPMDRESIVDIQVSAEAVARYELKASETELLLTSGSAFVVPAVTLLLELKDGFRKVPLPQTVVWKSSDDSVAAVYDGKIEARTPGTCRLLADVDGHAVTVPVTVVSRPPESAEDPPATPSEPPEEPAETHEHIAAVLPPVTATCVTTGLSVGARCKICGKVLQPQQVLPKTAHTYTEKKTKGSFQKQGKLLRVCSLCGHRESTTIPAVTTVRLSEKKYVFDGKRHTPKVRLLDENGTTLQRDKDYKLTYATGRKAVGTYQIKIQMTGDYKGSKTVSYQIVPQAVSGLSAVPAKASAQLRWQAAPGATHYVVYYSTTKRGGYQKLGTTSKTSASMVQLKSGKVYYFRVRSITRADEKQWNGALSSPVRVVAK